MTAGQRLAIGSTGIALAVLGLKGAAWWLTGSAALFGDALESAVNVVAGVGTLVALRVAAGPADASRSHGNAKPAFFVTVAEGVLVVIAAIAAFRYAWAAWNELHPLAMPVQGLALNAAGSLLNGVWCIPLIRAGRRLRAPVLVADGRHKLSGVAASAAMLVGVGLSVLTGLPWLDPLLGAAMGGHVLWAGTRLVSGSVDRLMDAAPAPAVAERVRVLVGEHAEGAIEAHGLRMRSAGNRTFLEFDLVVAGSMSVADSHAICDRIEAALQAEIGDLVITIHVEPELKAKQQGVLVL